MYYLFVKSANASMKWTIKYLFHQSKKGKRFVGLTPWIRFKKAEFLISFSDHALACQYSPYAFVV